jgi:hypothetical protein
MVVHNRSIVRRTLASGLTILVGSLLMNGCGLPRSNVVTYTAYQLTCCSRDDIDQVWQPGTTVELHWILGISITTLQNPTHKTVVSAELLGPYSDVDTLKHEAGAAHVVPGSMITIDDRVPPQIPPVSSFYLAPDLPPGYYRLNFKSDFGGGGSAGGSSIVRVGTQ